MDNPASLLYSGLRLAACSPPTSWRASARNADLTRKHPHENTQKDADRYLSTSCPNMSEPSQQPVLFFKNLSNGKKKKSTESLKRFQENTARRKEDWQVVK